MDKEKLRKRLEEQNSAFDDLISNTKAITDNIQAYSKVKSINDYKLKVINSIPDNLNKDEESNLISIMSTDLEYWNENTPRILAPQSLDPSTGITKTLNTATGSAQYFVNHLNDNNSEINTWANDSYNTFLGMTDIDDILRDNRSFLVNLYSIIGDEYDIAIHAYTKFENGLSTQYDFAISLRNVLESIYGNIIEKARAYNRSQRINVSRVKWPEMCDALAKNGINSQEHDQLVLEETNYNELKFELTNIAKNDKTDTLTGYKLLFIRFNNHIYNISRLVDSSRI